MDTKRGRRFVVGYLLRFWQWRPIVHQRRQKKLYVKIEENGSVKIGTCQHCVIRERGRPVRSWNAAGDAELDFPRDRLLQRLAEFGLQVEIKQEYVCP